MQSIHQTVDLAERRATRFDDLENHLPPAEDKEDRVDPVHQLEAQPECRT